MKLISLTTWMNTYRNHLPDYYVVWDDFRNPNTTDRLWFVGIEVTVLPKYWECVCVA